MAASRDVGGAAPALVAAALRARIAKSGFWSVQAHGAGRATAAGNPSASALLRRAIQGAAGDKAARTLAAGMGFMRVPGTVVKGTLTAH